MKDSSTSVDKSLGTKKKIIKETKNPSWKLPWVTKGKVLQDKVFKIKIADLLNETGREDEMVFEHKFSDQLPNLDAEGVSWIFTIQSLDDTSLLGTLTDVVATFHETCESCGKEFLRSVHIPSYIARFVLEDEKAKKEAAESEEVVLFIDPKAETINIEDMVVQSILLNDPFVKRCDACIKRLENTNDEDDFGEFETKGNITFS